MAHKTLISGTAYSVTGGREMIGGTGYGCKAGKTLIGGTAFTIPFAKGIPLSTITPGAILYLNESGSPVPFYIAKHDYESGLNGAGRTLVVRKNCSDGIVYSGYNDYSYNAYARSRLDSWLNVTYLKRLDADTQTAISKTKFYYTPGGGDLTVTTLQRAVFQLSLTELGISNSAANTEGKRLPIATTLKIAYADGKATAQWTRTPSKDSSNDILGSSASGRIAYLYYSDSWPSRPAFTLPGDLAVIANADGTYTLAA